MEFFKKVNDLTMEEVAPGIRKAIFSLDQIMAVFFICDPGVVFALHAHPHEQMGILNRGKIIWRTEEEESVIEEPAIYRVPSQMLHGLEVIGDEPAEFVHFFSPVREDFLRDIIPKYISNPSGT